MNKLFTKIAKIFLGLSMAAGVGVAIGSNVYGAMETAATDYEEIATFDFANNANTGSTSSELNGSSLATFLNTSCGVSNLVSSASITSGKVYNGKGSGGGSIPQRVLKSGQASKASAWSFTIASTYDNITKVSIFGHVWSTSTSVSVNSSSAQTYSTAQSDTAHEFPFEITGTKTISISVGSASLCISSLIIYKTKSNTFTVKYNANGGSNAPSNQTGLANLNSVNLASTASLTKFGYTSTGWSRDTNGATKHYNSGATGVNLSSYADANKTVTLYAYWEAKNYTGLTYTGEPSTKTYTTDDTFNPSGITAIYAKFDDVADTSTNVKSSISWNPLVKGTSATGTYTIGSVTQTVTITGLTITQVTSWTDTLTNADGAATGTSYATKTNVAKSSTARYTMTTNIPSGGGLAFRTDSNNSGIVSTTSGGIIGSVSVTGCQASRTIQVYGSNDAYTNPTDLFGNSKGQLLGTLTSTSTSLEIADEYAYVGVRSASGAVYMTSITFVWNLPPTDPVVELDKTSATQVELMRGDTDTSIKVHLKNIEIPSWTFTYDEGENTGLLTSSNISVSVGALDEGNVSTLTVTTKAQGSTGVTTLHISVSGTACATTIPITVVAKPAAGTLVAKLSSEVVTDTVEVKTGAYKQFTFAAQDTDGNAYSVASDDITGQKQSGTATVTISGTRVTGNTAGDVVVRYTLKKLTSVYVDISMNVVNDYITTVNTISVINGVSVEQGNTLTVSSHISAKIANTHFSSTMTIPDEELLFSYTNNRATGVTSSNFVWDVTNSTLVPPATETRTVYVFASFDSNYAGTSFTAVISVADRPVTGLLVNGVAATDGQEFEIEVDRHNTYQLNVSVNPTNATESHQIDYDVFDQNEGAGVSVSNTGLITVGDMLGEVACISATSHANSDHVVYFNVTVVRETPTITYDAPATYTKITSTDDLDDGDYLIVYETGELVFDGSRDNDQSKIDAGQNNQAVTISSSSIENADAYHFSIEAVSGGYSIMSASGFYIGAENYANELKTSATTPYANNISFDGDGNVVIGMTLTGGTVTLRYNKATGSSNERFRYYKSGQEDIQLYKKSSGGELTVTASEDLMDVLDLCMTYSNGRYTLDTCDASGATFDTEEWSEMEGYFTTEIIDDNHLSVARSNVNGHIVEQFLSAYDYAIEKHGESYDFLERVESGKITLSPRVSPISFVVGNQNTVAIIVIISMVSVTAIGGYFFLRRRKKQ